jgi:hypothetical protein
MGSLRFAVSASPQGAAFVVVAATSPAALLRAQPSSCRRRRDADALATTS